MIASSGRSEFEKVVHLGCINPKHLRWATRQQNALDALEHGTSSMFAAGEAHPNAKLSQADVEKNKERADWTWYSNKISAAFFRGPRDD